MNLFVAYFIFIMFAQIPKQLGRPKTYSIVGYELNPSNC